MGGVHNLEFYFRLWKARNWNLILGFDCKYPKFDSGLCEDRSFNKILSYEKLELRTCTNPKFNFG